MQGLQARAFGVCMNFCSHWLPHPFAFYANGWETTNPNRWDQTINSPPRLFSGAGRPKASAPPQVAAFCANGWETTTHAP